MKKIFIALLIFVSYTKAEVIETNIRIDTVNSFSISNRTMLFGNFFEFMNNFMNGPSGIWAQEIIDRGFDCYAYSPYARNWEWLEPQSDGKVKLLDGGYNENGQYYQNIKNDETQQYSGIKQTIYYDSEIGGKFYIYLKNRTTEPSRFVLQFLSSKDNKPLYTDTIDISNIEWKKYSLDIPPFESDNHITVTLCLAGKGEIDLDEVSLMPSNNVNGIRREFFDLFRKWRPGIIRYPGGYFADTELSHLDYMIGDIDKRKSPQLLGGYYQRMDLGITELMTFLDSIDAQAHMVVNLREGAAEEAANWVDYCNGDSNSIYGKRRIKDGHLEKYNVKYWEIGNEQWDDISWMFPRYLEYYDAMKKKDSSIKCMVDGDFWRGNWYFDTCMSYVKKKCEVYTWHPIYGVKSKYLGLPDTAKAYGRVMAFSNYINDISLEQEKRLIKKDLYPNCTQAITEHCFLWGEAPGWHDTTFRNSTLEAGLYEMSNLLTVLRYSKTMEMYEKTFGIGHIRVGYNKSGKRIVYPTPFHVVLEFLANNSGDIIYKLNVNTPKFRTGLFDDTEDYDIPLLDAMATSSDDTVYIYLINRSLDKEMNAKLALELRIDTVSIKAYELYSPSILDFNSPDEPNKISFKDRELTNINEILLKPHSVLVIKAKFLRDTLIIPPKEIMAYPNPAGDVLYIKNFRYFNVEYNITNLFGQIVQRGDSLKESLSISKLPPGIYFLKIGDFTYEFVKI